MLTHQIPLHSGHLPKETRVWKIVSLNPRVWTFFSSLSWQSICLNGQVGIQPTHRANMKSVCSQRDSWLAPACPFLTREERCSLPECHKVLSSHSSPFPKFLSWVWQVVRNAWPRAGPGDFGSCPKCSGCLKPMPHFKEVVRSFTPAQPGLTPAGLPLNIESWN